MVPLQTRLCTRIVLLVLLHDSLTDRESESRPLLASAEAGVKDLREILLRDALACVGKVNDRESSRVRGRIIVSEPPIGVCRKALRARFRMTCCRPLGSPSISAFSICSCDLKLDSRLLGQRTNERHSILQHCLQFQPDEIG